MLESGEGSLNVELWQVLVGLGATAIALLYVGQLAKQAIEEVEVSAGSSSSQLTQKAIAEVESTQTQSEGSGESDGEAK